VILLPLVAALGYASRYLGEGLQLFGFRQEAAPNFPFAFAPMFHLPFAAALALGLWLYAGVRLLNALLVIALLEASTFSVIFTYYMLVAQFDLQDLRAPDLTLAFGTDVIVLWSVCYLLAASLWAPGMRAKRRWLAALVLWTLAAAAASLASRELRPSPLEITALIDGVRVFMAACIGFWLWRDQVATGRGAAKAAPERPPAHPAVASAAAVPVGRSKGSNDRIAFVVLTAVLVVTPSFVYPLFIMKVLCWALLACAVNLLMSHMGLLSFGHAMFFGSASYVSAYTIKNWGVSPELAIAFGTASASALGALFGLAISRPRLYFPLITLALAQMTYFLALEAAFTGGEDGIQGVPRGRLFGIFDLEDTSTLYLTVVGVFLAGFLLLHIAIHSPFGRALNAIREDEAGARSLGYNVEGCKVLLFVLSAMLAGLGGATNAIVFQFASLVDVHWTTSADAVLMALVGGFGTTLGPVVGAFTIGAMENYLADFGPGGATVAEGVIFVVCVLSFRRGIVGEFARVLRIRL
jgi:branched-chain amino acid transport system permease protein